jgi:hypothetical protein
MRKGYGYILDSFFFGPAATDALYGLEFAHLKPNLEGAKAH